MSNIPFEPKDGDYVSLIEKLGKTSIDEIKDEITKSQKEHNQHAGQLNSPSIEKNISNKNQQRAPSSVSIPNTGPAVTPNNLDSLVQKIFKILLFIGFVFVALITGYLAVVVDPEDEEIIFFPFIFFVVFVAVISSKLNKRKSKS